MESPSMKVQFLTGIERIEMGTLPKPTIKAPNEVLLRVKAVGVCGSDVHYYETGRIGSQVVEFPFIVGHECAGVVEEVGSGVRRVRPGDEVAVEPLLTCGRCDQCRMGRLNTCRNQKFLGCPGQIAGCLCEYIVLPEACCFPTEGRITLEQAVLCEPLAIGIYAVQQAHLSPTARIAILGTGPIGLSVLEAAKAVGIERIYATDKLSERMEAARRAGAIWVGNPLFQDVTAEILKHEPLGLDAVFECAGQQQTLDQGVDVLAPGGKMMLIGIPREERVSFIPDRMRRKELTLINVRRQNHCTQKAIDWVAEGKVNVDFMLTHRFTFEQTPSAFELAAQYRDGVIKAIIEI
jgi:L-iditol 2-dehydrogenase